MRSTVATCATRGALVTSSPTVRARAPGTASASESSSPRTLRRKKNRPSLRRIGTRPSRYGSIRPARFVLHASSAAVRNSRRAARSAAAEATAHG